MLLAIDIGNTDMVFGVYDQGQWAWQWRIPSKQETDPEWLRHELLRAFADRGLSRDSFNHVVLSSVVPDLTGVAKEAAGDILKQKVLILGPRIYPLLDVGILSPEEIGTDLVANAVAAYHRYQQACIVVDFGTALTFTAIDGNGLICGVAIAPGLKTAMKALFLNAAQLPEVILEVPESVLGKNTGHALQAGILLGYIGLIESLLDRIQTELDQKCRIIATGGLSSVLTPLKKRFDEIDRNLTLEGLRLVAERVAGGK